MSTFITFGGLILNLVGTVIVSISAKTLFTSIHVTLMAHQMTLETYLGGEQNIPLFTGLDDTREKELKRSSRVLRLGLWLIVFGFILQVFGLLPTIFAWTTTK